MYRDAEKPKNPKRARAELQQIAVREGNQKSAVITQQLLTEQSKGVPRLSRDVRLSTKSVTRSVAQEEEEENGRAEPSSGSLQPMESTPKRYSGREGHDDYETGSQGEVDSLLRLTSTPVLARRSRRSLTVLNADVEQRRETTPQQEFRTRPSKRARIPEHATPQRNQKKQRLDPSLKDVRYVLREMRGHTDSLPEFQRMIEKTTALLEEAREKTEVIQAEVEEMVCLRWCVEEDIVKKMKKDRFLIDGTTTLGTRSTQGAAWRRWQAEQAEDSSE